MGEGAEGSGVKMGLCSSLRCGRIMYGIAVLVCPLAQRLLLGMVLVNVLHGFGCMAAVAEGFAGDGRVAECVEGMRDGKQGCGLVRRWHRSHWWQRNQRRWQ